MAFDAIIPERFGASELAIAPSFTTLRTTGSQMRDLVKSIDIANNNSVDAIVNIHLVPTGDSPDNDNILIPGITVKANSIVQWGGVQVMNEGATIQANSSVADVCVQVSGGEAT